MSKRQLCLIVFAAIFLVQTDVINAGSSTFQGCNYFIDLFIPSYNVSNGFFDLTFQSYNASLYAVSTLFAHSAYTTAVKDIAGAYYTNGLPVMQNAVNVASVLTGYTVEYINKLLDGTITNPPSPISCLFKLLFDLNTKFRTNSDIIASISKALEIAHANSG